MLFFMSVCGRFGFRLLMLRLVLDFWGRLIWDQSVNRAGTVISGSPELQTAVRRASVSVRYTYQKHRNRWAIERDGQVARSLLRSEEQRERERKEHVQVWMCVHLWVRGKQICDSGEAWASQRCRYGARRHITDDMFLLVNNNAVCDCWGFLSVRICVRSGWKVSWALNKYIFLLAMLRVSLTVCETQRRKSEKQAL